MANNRMWLVHKPTGLAVRLGKRMGGGYYGVPEKLGTQLQHLFDITEFQGGPDDYCLAFESLADSPPGPIDWFYGDRHPVTTNWANENGIQKLGGWSPASGL